MRLDILRSEAQNNPVIFYSFIIFIFFRINIGKMKVDARVQGVYFKSLAIAFYGLFDRPLCFVDISEPQIRFEIFGIYFYGLLKLAPGIFVFP